MFASVEWRQQLIRIVFFSFFETCFGTCSKLRFRFRTTRASSESHWCVVSCSNDACWCIYVPAALWSLQDRFFLTNHSYLSYVNLSSFDRKFKDIIHVRKYLIDPKRFILILYMYIGPFLKRFSVLKELSRILYLIWMETLIWLRKECGE